MARRIVGSFLSFAAGVLATSLMLGADAPAPNPAHRAIEPVAPVLPADVVAAMQEKRYEQAATSLVRMEGEAKAEDQAYFSLIRGIAQRLGGKKAEARGTLTKAIEGAPKGPWAAKLRFELATLEVAEGKFAAAEALAREEAQGLLAGDRKDRLAVVYENFAKTLLKPDDPITPADPESAYALLDQARQLARGDALRARLLLAKARASRQANNLPRAIADFQAYVSAKPAGADAAEARFELADAQLNAGQPLQARLAWADLARDLAGKTEAPLVELRARALLGIARTHGIPAPADDTQLNLGVAALRRFLAAAPAHPKAVRAAYDIGASYLSRGKTQEAYTAFLAFLKGDGYKAESDEARRELAALTPTATFQVGQVLQQQGKFADAIEAWKGYLAKFPDGPQSADAQRLILDTQLAIADDLARREAYDKARAAWTAFAAQNPLDPRVPSLLFRVGESFLPEKKPDAAVAAWEPLLSRFPDIEPAAHAQFEIARIREVDKGDPAAAVDLYRKISVSPWAQQAQARIAVMESRHLQVISPKAYRSGEAASLKVTTRNLETLTFTAYKLDAEAYFRKKHGLQRDIAGLDIGLVAPDAEWTVPVAGYGKFKTLEHDYPLPKLTLPGVYVVRVTDEKHLQATTLVLGSDLDAIVKTSRDQILVFAQDMKTGKGRAGARVLVSDGGAVILDAKAGPDGVLLSSWKEPRGPGSSLTYLVLDGPDAAGSGLSVPGEVAQGLSARAYLYTDRPAYRPGQSVELRGVVREVKDGQYENPAGIAYTLEVTDSRGRLLLSRPATLSAFGTFHERVALDESAPVGDYRVRISRPGRGDFSGGFRVDSYKLEKITLSIDLPKTVYIRGESVKAKAVASYQYGSPAAGRPIEVTLPDGRTVAGSTDAAGAFAVEFATDGFAEEQALRIVARLPQDDVAAAADVRLAVQGFRLSLETRRTVYLDGESFGLDVIAVDAQGKPAGRAVKVSVLKQVTRGSVVAEREISTASVTTDTASGRGTAPLKIDDIDGGTYVLRASGVDQFDNPIVADRVVTVSGKKDETKLRLIADRTQYKVGEKASINLHSRSKAGTALLAWEADRVLRYKVQTIAEGDNPLTWDVDGAEFPNFTLTAARMVDTRFDEARLDLKVERELVVRIEPKRPSARPGEEIEVEVTTVDQLGKPVAAELSLALVDRALLRRFPDTSSPISEHFYNQSRTNAFTTAATNTFRDAPQTVPVPEAVVEEMESAAALAANEASKAAIINRAQLQVAGDMPAPAMAPMMGMGMAGKGEMGGGMGGMMGRMGKKSKEGLVYDNSSSSVDNMSASIPANGLPVLGRRAVEMETALGENAPAEARQLFARDQKLGVEPRQQFVETAYWNPAVVTDAKGKATLTIKAPAALSEYRFTAKGVTGADTLVGQTTASLVVRKDVFVDLKVPATLTQGDSPRFVAQLHHNGVKGKASLILKAYAGDRETSYPREIELTGDGVEEILFEGFEVPESDQVRLTASVKVGDQADELTVEVPVRPWGVQAIASASGTSSNDSTAIVGLPEGRAYENAEMLVVVSPTVQRMLIELAMQREFMPMPRFVSDRIMPPPSNTLADRASDLIGAAAVLKYLNATKAQDAPEAGRLVGRIRGLVAELITAQNDDGGWPWVAGPIIEGKVRPGDRMTSAHVTLALAAASKLGLLSDPAASERATTYLAQEIGKVEPADHEARAAILHALSAHGKATFEAANSLNRLRQGLPDSALAYLALTLVNLDRVALAGEILDVLGTRAKQEQGAPGDKPRIFWPGTVGRGHAGPTESTALAALAYAAARPGAAQLEGAVRWLEAHRTGFGWRPEKAEGFALAALAAYHGRAADSEDRYRLVITVNDVEVHRADVTGVATGKALLVPAKAIKAAGSNRVRFDIEGRGTYGYSVTLTGFTRDFGPDQNSRQPFSVAERVYTPADPEFNGRPIAAGFGVALNAQGFRNTVSQVASGGRARVHIEARRNQNGGVEAWRRDFLILEDTLPAGTTLIDGSVKSSAQSHTYADGLITFYFGPDDYPGTIEYDIAGYLPGKYRTLPTKIRSAYEPGRVHLGKPGEITVIAPGEPTTDPYRPTPDELYARGKALFDEGKIAESAAPLEALFAGYTLRDDVASDAARMLLSASVKAYDARKVVQYFEVLKEKAPDLVIPFDEILVVGRAYRDINEHERAYLVWRAIAEASYLEDARVGEAIRQRGRTLEGLAMLMDLWREYPDTASIQGDFFGLSQVLADAAGRALTEPALRKELAQAGVTRSELLLQAIRITQVFLALSPENPMADEASLGLVGAFLDLEDFESVVKLTERFAKLYPKSTFLDSFQYSEALGRFQLGQYDRAIAVAESINAATYKDAAGVDQPSPNKWQAVYILGQIYDARRQPARAIEFYTQVADKFSDAAEAINGFKRKDLKLPEVVVIRPADDKAPGKPGVTLDYRNVAEVELKVYPVDLMRLYLTRRNLDGIAGVDLAGIKPLHEVTVKLGDGDDYADKSRRIELPLTKEGAYLVMARGGELHTSGIVLISPLEVEALEDAAAGRVRVTVRDSASKDLVPKVQVKVIGDRNAAFLSGQTDLRGVFTAEGVGGRVTAVVRRGAAQYAFFRGKTPVGPTPPNVPLTVAPPAPEGMPGASQSLDQNLKILNGMNRVRQMDRLQQRYNNEDKGVQIQQAK
ncbi:MG2 domain-containing protein [Isosphaeraceae bacterium EP7]